MTRKEIALELTAQGLSPKQVAEQLGISRMTVYGYRRFRKYDKEKNNAYRIPDDLKIEWDRVRKKILEGARQ